jgi:thioredoxin 1
MNTEEIKTGRVLVDFYADWCAPCKTLSKQLDQYINEVTSVKVVKINVEEDQDTPAEFGVRSIPALFYMEDGKIINQSIGVKTLEQLKEFTKIK